MKNFDVFFYITIILFKILFVIIKKPPFGEAVFIQSDIYIYIYIYIYGFKPKFL